MDGNGRWAKQRGLPRIEGHRRGVETVRVVTRAARELGIRYLTLYAFSVENWKRPQDEVGGLMSLLEYFLKRETATLVRDQVRLRTIGRTAEMPPAIRDLLAKTCKATESFTELTLTLALNYGARTEVLDAAASWARAVAGTPAADRAPTWEEFSRHLYTADLPDPDLIIRSSGEMRVSNFLLMQAAYAEFVFTPTLWPDFSKADLETALADYARRERRFGLTSEQLGPVRTKA
ncbi:ditrans,polycis-undecaprenyl-diphosphate synthase [mine drainage metagenome]|uniref:Ditrans,polycis-undecaprenyl-diphosphate synthase n=1 Tax=mine drainage metagenome TaxID=410659 RepID=A0A1J5TF97_9ZZZZ